jgi:hypothetical protein
MAYSRCISHPPKNHNYSRYGHPVGYPNSSTICGISGCNQQGLIWLNDDEQNQFASGVRIFTGPNNQFTKMRTDDTALINRNFVNK